MVTLDRLGIPKKVLTGKDPKYLKVFNLYRALMMQEFTRILNESYWERARNQDDSDGNHWDELKPKTISFKMGLDELYDYRTGGLNDKKLDPRLRKKFQEAYKRALGKSTSQAAKRIAVKAAWAQVTADTPEREFVELINIRTGDLVASTAPGTVVGGRYYPPQHQIVHFNGRSMGIRLDIEYADEVDALRPIIPEDISIWLERAHNNVIGQVKALYVDMQSAYLSRQREVARRRRERSARRNKAKGNNGSTRGKGRS